MAGWRTNWYERIMLDILEKARKSGAAVKAISVSGLQIEHLASTAQLPFRSMES